MDLKDMFNLLQDNPDQNSIVQKDLLLAQQLISDSLKKVKKNVSYKELSYQGKLFSK
ncbi:MAG: hypothetical protein JW982_07495 [Spirochaetes bacterium]|nr:hypothetical protein [Spirochaetota bacterium]